MRTPAIVNFVGEVVDVTEDILTDGGKPFRLITIVSPDGKKHQVITSGPQLEKFKLAGISYAATLENGFNANLECEERIANVTEYEDEEGVVKQHTSTGFALRSVLPLTSFQKKLVEKEAFANFNDSRLDSRVAKLRALGFENDAIAISLQGM